MTRDAWEAVFGAEKERRAKADLVAKVRMNLHNMVSSQSLVNNCIEVSNRSSKGFG